jgi:hypothetical protein
LRLTLLMNTTSEQPEEKTTQVFVTLLFEKSGKMDVSKISEIINRLRSGGLWHRIVGYQGFKGIYCLHLQGRNHLYNINRSIKILQTYSWYFINRHSKIHVNVKPDYNSWQRNAAILRTFIFRIQSLYLWQYKVLPSM